MFMTKALFQFQRAASLGVSVQREMPLISAISHQFSNRAMLRIRSFAVISGKWNSSVPSRSSDIVKHPTSLSFEISNEGGNWAYIHRIQNSNDLSGSNKVRHMR
jgi:hypothetical protein